MATKEKKKSNYLQFMSKCLCWLDFTACQPIEKSFYAEYIFIYDLTLFMNFSLQLWELFNANNKQRK